MNRDGHDSQQQKHAPVHLMAPHLISPELGRCDEQPGAVFLDDDVSCTQCGYNLRGLQVSGSCPECNAPVERSQLGFALEYADARWVARVHLGLRLMGYGLLLIGVILAGVLAALLCGFSLSPNWWISTVLVSSDWRALVQWSLYQFCVLYYSGTVWCLMAQEPRLRDREAILSVRRGVRFGGVLLATNVMLRVVGLCCTPARYFVDNPMGYPIEVAVIGISFLMIGVYMSGFASRGHCRGLKRETLFVVIGLAGASLLAAAIRYVGRVLGWADTDWVYSTLLAMISLVALVCFILYLVVLRTYSRVFGEARSRQKTLGSERI